MFTFEQIKSVVDIIVNNVKPIKIILFGSYANGEEKNDSDVDLMIVKNTEFPPNKRASEVRKYLRGLKIPMDIIVYTEKEFEEEINSKYSLAYSVALKGKVLYES